MKILAMCVVFLVLVPVSYMFRAATPVSVAIYFPTNGNSVDPRHEVSGVVSDPNAEVWVVIHPVETSDFFVQPPVAVRERGYWTVLAFFGEAGKHVGKRFEVRAFVNPVETLSEGKRAQWPKSVSRSDVVEVTRR